jgi:hypothetical protein
MGMAAAAPWQQRLRLRCFCCRRLTRCCARGRSRWRRRCAGAEEAEEEGEEAEEEEEEEEEEEKQEGGREVLCVRDRRACACRCYWSCWCMETRRGAQVRVVLHC